MSTVDLGCLCVTVEERGTMGGWSCQWTHGEEGGGVKVRQRRENLTLEIRCAY